MPLNVPISKRGISEFGAIVAVAVFIDADFNLWGSL